MHVQKASVYEDSFLTIYSNYLELQPAGAEYKAICPFHNDHNPSFFVNPETGLYHCFGCGASGNVWQFLQNYLGVDFHEAVKITSRYGIVPEGYSPNGHKKQKEQKPSKDEIIDIIAMVEGEDKVAHLRKEQEKPKPSFVVVDKFYPRPFTEEITGTTSFWFEGGNGDFYYFDKQKGIWRDNAEDYIKHYFRTATETIQDTQKRTYILNEIVNDVRDCSWKGERLPEPKLTLIPFRNGVYDLDSDEFRTFKKDDYFTWTLPHNYNPDANCPFLYELINSLLPEEQVVSLWELMGYCLWRQYCYRKFFILFGRGSNGKSTFARILEKMVGQENVSHVSMKDFQENRFAPSELHKKLLNVSGELEYEELRNTKTLKELTGQDTIRAERKYKEPFRFVNYAKLVFLTNEVPKSRDTTEAFYERLFLIEFTKVFKEDPTLAVKIENLPEEEWEGLLILTLDQLRKLKRQNFVFSKHIPLEENKRLYEKLSSPLHQFVGENCVVTYDRNDYIFKFEFLQRFKDWLNEKGRTAYSETRLKQEMNELGLDEGRRGDKNYHCWIGLKWKQTQEEDKEQVYELTL